MPIWVDADSCPKVIKEILFRAADRTAVQVTLVANRLLYTPSSPYISAIQVADGFDVADSEIVERLEAGDLVITADIPLAAEVIEKGGHALDPRGEMHLDLEGKHLSRFDRTRLASRLAMGTIEPGTSNLRHRAVRRHVGETHKPIAPCSVG